MAGRASIRGLIFRPLEWLAARFMPADDPDWDATDGPTYAADRICSCAPPAVAQHGDRHELCPRCGGRVVYLSQTETDRLRRQEDE